MQNSSKGGVPPMTGFEERWGKRPGSAYRPNRGEKVVRASSARMRHQQPRNPRVGQALNFSLYEDDKAINSKIGYNITPKPRRDMNLFEEKKETTPTRASLSLNSKHLLTTVGSRGGAGSLRRSTRQDKSAIRDDRVGSNTKTERSTKRTQKIIRSTSGLGIFSQEIEQKVAEKEKLKQQIKDLKLGIKHMDQETRDIAKREEELYTEANKLQKQTSKNEDGSLMIRKEIQNLKKWINRCLETVEKYNQKKEMLRKRCEDEVSLIECLSQITPNLKRDLLSTQKERENLRMELIRSVKIRKQVEERKQNQLEENAKFVKMIRRTVNHH